MIVIEPDDLREVLDLAEESISLAEENGELYKEIVADLRLELSSTVMDLDTCLAEKEVLIMAIFEAGALIAEGNIAAAQTLIEELSK
jgi:hypothetical protein